ncbi:IS481 family transposase [Streptomyces olivaceoviridis]
MSHRNAPLTPTGRLRLARCVVDDGWPLRRAAERFQVSHTTAARWASRYRQLGEAGMQDRSSRPHRQPRRTPAAVEARVLRLRREHRIGPLRLAARAGIAASTAHRILVRHGLPPLAACDRATGEPVRRYERARPGELVHIDVKKLGRIPDGGGHKVLGRADGRRNKTSTGYTYLHTALDDHSPLAYTEDLPDEKAATCVGFLRRATAWFAQQGVAVERVLTDNAWAYTKNTCIVCTTNAIESVNARIRRAVKARGHFPNETAALKCVYMAIMSLDPTGKGQARWTMRWKTALNAFDITFNGRLSAARQ